MGNVVSFPGTTTLPIDPDSMLEANKGTFETVILGGIDKNGEFVFGASTPDGGLTLIILEKFKAFLLNEVI